MNNEVETVEADVLIIGAGGAGMRAAISVNDAGLKPEYIFIFFSSN